MNKSGDGLPAHVDPAKKEMHLSDSDFKSVFSMTKEDFKKLPTWKQTTAKKRHSLF